MDGIVVRVLRRTSGSWSYASLYGRNQVFRARRIDIEQVHEQVNGLVVLA